MKLSTFLILLMCSSEFTLEKILTKIDFINGEILTNLANFYNFTSIKLKKMKTISVIILAMFLVSCGTSKTYQIQSKSGTNTSGTVKFCEVGNSVKMKISAENLTPGIHAIHIHEKGDCSAPDATSAGGHWNPMKDMHGKWGTDHHHNGDIGNLIADENGKATLTFKTDMWCLTCKDDMKNIIGKSIIIHAKEDDFTTQPTGNAGGRIGCIEIK